MRTNREESGGSKALSPVKAAQIIVNGIEHNAYQLFMEKDAFLINKLNRLCPPHATRLMAKAMGALLNGGGDFFSEGA
jgi:Fe-S cluster biosynthesis and repair protein YggX